MLSPLCCPPRKLSLVLQTTFPPDSLGWVCGHPDLPRLAEACSQAPVTDPCLHHLVVISILENRVGKPASHKLQVEFGEQSGLARSGGPTRRLPAWESLTLDHPAPPPATFSHSPILNSRLPCSCLLAAPWVPKVCSLHLICLAVVSLRPAWGKMNRIKHWPRTQSTPSLAGPWGRGTQDYKPLAAVPPLNHGASPSPSSCLRITQNFPQRAEL